MSEEHKQLFQHLMEEVFNKGNYDAADQLVAPNFLNHEASEGPRGPEGFKATARWLHNAFPDLHAVLHETVAEGDLVVGRITLSGTHRGEFMGAQPTGQRFSVQHLHMYRIADGKLVEHWACRDDVAQLAQLGLMRPAMPGPGGERRSRPAPE
ncbi:MAG TPA: ester cyclase [Pseudonocardiaceae bacterium]|jgi:predicted ester cyclase|nr:ester cyclase [Pseudonocardiaceae bacterium]